MKTISIKDYFEIVKPKYIILKVIPHLSIRNYDSSNIAKAVQTMYRTLNQQIRIDRKKLKIKVSYKLSFFIDINKEDVSFYFLVPERYLNLFIEKISQTWKEVKIEQVSYIKQFSDNADIYGLTYKKEDALSLKVDKRSNILLSNILNVLDIMKEEDRIGILYNFMPRNQNGWKQEHKRTIDKFNNNELLDKKSFNKSFIVKKIFEVTINILNSILYGLSSIFSDDNRGLKEIAITNVFNKKELTKTTLKKSNDIVLDMQMIVLCDSKDRTRKNNNALSVLESYNTISDDNSLIYRKTNTKTQDINSIPTRIPKNTVSADECQNFLQIPGRSLLERFKNIKHGNILENPLPEELQKGYIRLGENDYKGDIKMAYMSDDKNFANLGLVVMGPQGSGKSEYFKNYASDVIRAAENLIVLDFIKNCELSSDIESVVPKEKLLIIDMAKEQDLQGFGYNEIKFRNNMSEFEILETANLISQQDMALIDAINADGSPLTSRMRRYLSAAANLVHLQENKSLRDVINVLEDFHVRQDTIDNISNNLKVYLEDEIRALKELDEIKEFKDKETKETYTEVVGTKDSKIEHILDRINLLKEDFKLKFMFNKSLENNIDFAEQLDQGKVILIKIPEHKYPLKYVKNVIVTYFTTKIWLASQIRGKIHEKPLRTHVLLDEIFQAPTSENMLKNILPQCRKFQLKFIISAHYLSQIETIREPLKASGASYMLLQGTDKKNYRELEEELQPFQLEDLLNLKRYYSLNLIKTKQGFASFISKLPTPIK